MKKHLIAVCTTIAMLFVGTAGAVTPTASTNNLDQAMIDFIEQQFVDFAVPESQWNALIDAYAAGELDSDDPSSQPVSIESMSVNGIDYDVQRFPDGSFTATGVQEYTDADPNSALLRSVTGCTRTYSGGVYAFQKCKVDANSIGLHMWFYANFSQWAGGSQISSAWGRQWEASQTCTLDSFGVTRTSGGTTTPAMATMWMTCSDTWSGSSSSEYLGLRVTSSSYYSVDSV